MTATDPAGPEALLWVLTTTVPAAEAAERIAQAALQARLAACVQVQAVQAHYWWEGSLRAYEEQRLSFKTTAGARLALQALVARLHPYEVPEILAWEAVAAGPYADWARGEVAV